MELSGVPRFVGALADTEVGPPGLCANSPVRLEISLPESGSQLAVVRICFPTSVYGEIEWPYREIGHYSNRVWSA